MKISFEEEKNFLENIKKTDKIAIFTHTDLDRIVCGVLFYDFFKKKDCIEIDVFFIDYWKNKISDFNISNKMIVIISDFALENILQDLMKIPEKIKVFYTDHHQSKENIWRKNIYEFRTTDLGFIPSSRTVYELVWGKKWLSVLGVLADFGNEYEENKEFLNEFFEESGKSLNYFKEEVMYMLARAIIYFEKNKEKSFFYILKGLNSIEELKIFKKYNDEVQKEFNKFVREFKEKSEKKGKIKFFYFEPEYNIKSILINYISSFKKDEIYVFLTPSNEKVNISLRNQSREFNLYNLIKDATKNLKDSSSGGHLNAAGATIRKKDFKKFKNNLFLLNLQNFRG